jgi:signal recognition particle GTPase
MNLDDLRKQIVELNKSGLARGFVARIRVLDHAAVDRGASDFELDSRRIVGMIDSMTGLERSYPFLITIPGRCARIAEGAGVEPSEVATFFIRFKAMSDAAMRLRCGGRRVV